MKNPVPINNIASTLFDMKKILIVDDEEDICYFLGRNLSKRGFLTNTSYTLAEAEKQLQNIQPDILLLDNHLPDGRGIDFAKKIHTQYPDLKIIMITAHDSPEDRSKAYSNGIQYFLSKPFSITTVNQVVDLVL
ncbi:MAG: response regulator [Bacteroidota bacterium]|nr:response regulator [Bacteroidota bacterium]